MADLLFLVTLALIPVQTNKFFFFSFSYVWGIPIDYRAASVYLLDISVLFYIIFFIIFETKSLKKKFKQKKPFFLSLLILAVYLILDALLFSASKIPSLIFSLKITIFCIFSAFASITLEKAKIRPKLVKIIAFSIFWELALVLMEFLKQKSIGFQILGERTFDTTTNAISHVNVLNYQLLRPYGTFPHPNVLGIFFAIYLLLFFRFKKTSNNNLQSFTVLAGLIGVLISFSKDAVLSISAAYLLLSRKISQFVTRAIVFCVIVILVFKYLIESDFASAAERVLLLQASLSITSASVKSLLLGVGSNNFIPNLATLNITSLSQVRLLQPVHNVFLLVLAENGVFGLMIFVFFLASVAKYLDRPAKNAIFIVLIIGMLIDHFFWTLEQSQTLFFLACSAIIASQTVNTSKG